MKSALEEVSHTLVFAVNDLRECLKKGDAVDALIILQLIGQAVNIQNAVNALIAEQSANESEAVIR